MSIQRFRSGVLLRKVFPAFGWAMVVLFPCAGVAAEVGPIPQWIWSTPSARRNETVLLIKTFTVSKQVKRAEALGLADEGMTVFLNGKRAGTVGGFREFVRIDVTKALQTGLNILAIQGEAGRGAGGVLLKLRVQLDDGSTRVITTDPTWFTYSGALENVWRGAATDGWRPAVSLGLLGSQPWGDPVGEEGDYYQWQDARGTKSASDVANIQVINGFEVELLRSSQPGEGSWVSLAFDPKGRLTVGREGPGLIRLTFPEQKGGETKVETINNTLLECRGLLYAFDALYANANNSKGLYRLRDKDGDDQFETVELLRATDGGVGHGRNDLTLGPDGFLYLIQGNDARLPNDYAIGDSPCRNYAVDRLRPCHWDRFLFDFQAMLPAGHVIRTDRDGKLWELVCCGMRNPYGIDFNEDGEMFTFDADNEGDMGLPWYRPTRVNHLVSGADYGWRQGSGNRPAFYPDSWPSNIDIGKASPTAVKFGTKSNFPGTYRQALFILDWAYGRILAVHLTPDGASYRGTVENFLTGKPLNVTDLEFGPDGAMYFVTGGRGTQSGLYRVRATGSAPKAEPTESPNASELAVAKTARVVRRELERYHRLVSPQAIEVAWRKLYSPDPWLRHAARIAIERQPVETWQQKALSETNTTAALTALMALTRCGAADLRPKVIARLETFELPKLTVEQQLLAVRTYQLTCSRWGIPDAETTGRIVKRVAAIYPSEDWPVNQLAVELLAALHDPTLPERSIPLLKNSRFQEEMLSPLFSLRSVRDGWTAASRTAYFEALGKASGITGGRGVVTYLASVRVESLATVPEDKRVKYTELMSRDLVSAAPAIPVTARPVVKEWKLDDFGKEIEAPAPAGSAERGRAIYTAGQCAQCHRFAGQGFAVGPDLNAVSRRFGRRDLLDQILNPSKVVDNRFVNYSLELKSGRVVTGRLITGDESSVLVSTNPLAFDQLTRVSLADIENQTASTVSPMPVGLLNGFTKEEISDLLAYLESEGREFTHRARKPAAGK